MSAVLRRLAVIFSFFLLIVQTGCGGSGGGGSVATPTTTTIDHHFLFFTGCEVGCESIKLYKYSVDDQNISTVGDGLIASVEDGYSEYAPILYVLNGKLYFSADDETNGYELWVYDPSIEESSSNPKMVLDAVAGASGSHPQYFSSLAGKLYFSANDGASGQELWVYDPDEAVQAGQNPKMVFDIIAGALGSSPSYLTAYDNKLYMQANDGATGQELWVYDPEVAASASNPSLVRDINTVGASGSVPKYLTVMGGKLYFSAGTAATGVEAYVFDSSQAVSATNPKVLYDIRSGASSSGAGLFKALNGILYFTANDGISGTELYSYDPNQATSATNPKIVYDIFGGGGSGVDELEVHNDKLYFAADNGSDGFELYVYDPQVAASATNPLLYDINSGAEDSNPHNLTSVGGLLYLGFEIGVTYSFSIFDENEAVVLNNNPNLMSPGFEDYVSDITALTYSETVTQ